MFKLSKKLLTLGLLGILVAALIITGAVPAMASQSNAGQATPGTSRDREIGIVKGALTISNNVLTITPENYPVIAFSAPISQSVS